MRSPFIGVISKLGTFYKYLCRIDIVLYSNSATKFDPSEDMNHMIEVANRHNNILVSVTHPPYPFLVVRAIEHRLNEWLASLK